MTARRGSLLILVAALMSAALSACGSPAKQPSGIASVVSAPVRVAQTSLGPVGYRVVGTGSPLVLIMGYGLTMAGWDPRLVHALAGHHRVVMFDNSGIGRTKQLPPPVSIDDMAGQASALTSALHLGRPDVLGWSMGGAIPQALAVWSIRSSSAILGQSAFAGSGGATVTESDGRLPRYDELPAAGAGGRGGIGSPPK